MPSNLFDHIVIEMTRVADQTAWNVESVLEALEDRVHQGELGPFPKLHLGVLGLYMQVLYPVMVGSGSSCGNMVFENNYPGVWDCLRV